MATYILPHRIMIPNSTTLTLNERFTQMNQQTFDQDLTFNPTIASFSFTAKEKVQNEAVRLADHFISNFNSEGNGISVHDRLGTVSAFDRLGTGGNNRPYMPRRGFQGRRFTQPHQFGKFYGHNKRLQQPSFRGFGFYRGGWQYRFANRRNRRNFRRDRVNNFQRRGWGQNWRRGRGQGRWFRGRGRGRWVNVPPMTRKQLDEQIDEYMSMAPGRLNAELDEYMQQSQMIQPL